MGPAHLTLVAVLSAWPIPSTPREPTVPAAAPAGSPVTPAPPAAAPIPAPPAVDWRQPPPAPVLEPPAPTTAVGDGAPVAPNVAPAAAPEGAQLAVRASPAPAKPRQPLYKKWWFWTIAGGLFTSVVTITYVETRPPPTPYHGSTSNGVNVITFP